MRDSGNKNLLILAVDDEPLILELISKTLLMEGYRVLTAGDGAAGLSLVREKDPDLILLDIKMPGQDGLLTLDHIRQITRAPVIMVTGFGGDEMVEKAINAGADDFIRKPFRPNELLARVKAKMRRR
ncbi:MAG: response regulator [Dehalococcoidales bacterium]|nr:response regulator [Dehalococcoidales bacterium]